MKLKSNKDLYKFAKSIIPGGTTLFSKRSELHLPDKWPAYFSKSKKINVWDLNGVKYLDMFCAVGTSILGYSNDRMQLVANRRRFLGKDGCINVTAVGLQYQLRRPNTSEANSF